jgi:Tol biopolymer transport system component
MSQIDLVGQKLGKYEIRAEIGRGGMGVVFLGYDPDLDRPVALKVLAPHLAWEAPFVERFLREARAAARLNHPHIVTIHDVGQDEGWYYFVMEYLEGQTLAEIIRDRGALPPDEALAILDSLAGALDYAHAEGLVHRDVKPVNVVVQAGGRVVLTDFGIARAAQETGLTRTGMVVGTPQYMSPEQARGEDLDRRSDVYSLGVVAYEMLGGRVPFDGTTPHAVLHQQIYESPPPLGQVRPDLPGGVEAVLDRALAKAPERRYPSAGELVGALGAALAGRGAKQAVPGRRAREKQTKGPSLSPRLLAGAAGLVAVAVVAVVLIVLLGGGGGPEPGTAAVAAGPTVTLRPTASGATVPPQPASDPATPVLYQTEEDGRYSLYATDLQGSGPYLLASGADAVAGYVSADGKWVTVRVERDEQYTVYLMGADGSDRQVLASDRTFAAAYFSGDGQKVRVYTRDLRGEDPSGPDRYDYGLVVMDSDGSDPVSLVNRADYASTSWTADGQRLALSVKRDDAYSLYVVNSDGSGQKTLLSGQGSSFNARLSDDGRWLFYQTYDGEIRRLYLSTADGGRPAELFSGFSSASPLFSPSGDTLAVSVYDSVAGREELYAVETASGRSLRLIAGGNVSDVSFSPDEAWIAAEVERAGFYQIYLLAVDGAQQKEIVGPGEGADWYASADFSPDGRRLLVRLGYREGETTDLYVMNADGGQRVALVRRAGWPVSGAFTPDGASIVFGTDADGGRSLYLAEADGSRPRKLVDGFEPVVAGGSPPRMYLPRPLPAPTRTPAPTAETEASGE